MLPYTCPIVTNSTKTIGDTKAPFTLIYSLVLLVKSQRSGLGEPLQKRNTHNWSDTSFWLDARAGGCQCANIDSKWRSYAEPGKELD